MLNNEIAELLKEAKSLAKKYRQLTGKPLGITGEVAEFTAAQLLGLDLCVARQPGYDAIKVVDGKTLRYQIKGRCLSDTSKGRVGAIRKGHECDYVLLVLMNEDYDVQSIYEAENEIIREALDAPGSKARNEGGKLSIRKFKSIGRKIWSRQSLDQDKISEIQSGTQIEEKNYENSNS